MSLKARIQNEAYKLGADLVGFGGIDRCAHAPLMMSPQGLFPGAKTVIVMAVHHPDACIELGGETHPQEIGPYSVQYLMNSRLDEMSYRLASFIERQGCGAVPIASSNIWRYNEYKDLKAVFAPDVSHIYMAVVAGLADLGFNGLALTPEYGARNRFITVITDAVIEPDPLVPPNTVCDQCMLCRKHCPSKALSTEISGDKVLKIGEYEYRFPDKNLWRCAWGEHFDLDLDLEIPEKVTEQVILDNVKKHGIRGGEMGQCLKFCVPKPVRMFDKDYSRTPMRRYDAARELAIRHCGEIDRILSRLMVDGADQVIISSAGDLRAKGLDLERILPGAACAVTLVVTRNVDVEDAEFASGAQYQMDSLCYDLTRRLEGFGYRSLLTIKSSGSHPDPMKDENPTGFILDGVTGLSRQAVVANTVITRAPLPSRRVGESRSSAAAADRGDATVDLSRLLSDYARSLGADLAGIASASRVDELTSQLRPLFEAETVLDAADRSHRFTPWDPVVTERRRQVRTAGDHLPGARSVLVFGLRLHEEVLRQATRPPAEAVGPYAFQTYVTNWIGSVIGYRLIKRLEAYGYKAVMSKDLTGTDSFTANPRGPQPDLFTNRFAGLAAGLGYLTVSGHLATPQFGLRQRCIAIITDAPLTPSPLYVAEGARNRCHECAEPCIGSCPSQAIQRQRIELTCEGQAYAFNRIDARRCDWVKRYALMGESGFKYLGSPLDVAPPALITEAALSAALRGHDPIKKYRPVIAEPCVINCPLAF